ncbi:hypothetical protein [Azospira oryzae]|uniref:hypothetical protein n=1 Tax=Azospira oryzae TaxID=146939 RepID=UPI0019628A84|nr:hypothetical protein [Azospira oryzae]
MKPTKTVELFLIKNSNGRTEATRNRRIIDVGEFPDEIGAYVIRYRTHKVPRFFGFSEILKIGNTVDSFKNRFRNYNHQCDLTVAGSDLYEALKTRSQKTNIRLMYFLAHTNHPSPIDVEFYYASPSSQPTEMEYELIRTYMTQHGELPPLNFGMK